MPAGILSPSQPRGLSSRLLPGGHGAPSAGPKRGLQVGTAKQHSRAQAETQAKLTRWGQGLNWAEPAAQNVWTLAFLLGGRQRPDFLHSGVELHLGQPFVFALPTVNLTTRPHPRGGQGLHVPRQQPGWTVWVTYECPQGRARLHGTVGNPATDKLHQPDGGWLHAHLRLVTAGSGESREAASQGP